MPSSHRNDSVEKLWVLATPVFITRLSPSILTDEAAV